MVYCTFKKAVEGRVVGIGVVAINARTQVLGADKIMEILMTGGWLVARG